MKYWCEEKIHTTKGDIIILFIDKLVISGCKATKLLVVINMSYGQILYVFIIMHIIYM